MLEGFDLAPNSHGTQMESTPYSLLAELDKAGIAEGARPPIHLWNPDQVKDIDMEIQADGRWFYLGTPIKRPRLTQLFASVMRLEGEDYYLVTPVEKCRIKVRDVPFMAILLDTTGSALKLTTNMGDKIELSEACPLRVVVDEATAEPALYVTVRDGLDAKLNRNVFYQMMELLEEQTVQGEPWHGVVSNGDFLPIVRGEDV